MKACLLYKSAPIETRPLVFTEIERPNPKPGEVLIKVSACGICRTDLHVVEGDLAQRFSPVIPGHQVVGIVEETGRDVEGFSVGDRVGVAWLHRTCGKCRFCLAGRENLCEGGIYRMDLKRRVCRVHDGTSRFCLFPAG